VDTLAWLTSFDLKNLNSGLFGALLGSAVGAIGSYWGSSKLQERADQRRRADQLEQENKRREVIQSALVLELRVLYMNASQKRHVISQAESFSINWSKEPSLCRRITDYADLFAPTILHAVGELDMRFQQLQSDMKQRAGAGEYIGGDTGVDFRLFLLCSSCHRLLYELDALKCPGFRGHLLKVFTLETEVAHEADTTAVYRRV